MWRMRDVLVAKPCGSSWFQSRASHWAGYASVADSRSIEDHSLRSHPLSGRRRVPDSLYYPWRPRRESNPRPSR